jgi:hypothetical protein
VPALKFWSDVVYLQWKMHSSPESTLKYVLRHNIMNPVTASIVEAINIANSTTTLEWPGTSYAATSEEGQALLGTPNGSGVAYLLVQHKQELGRKTIEKITVFSEVRLLMLLFHIVDVEEGTGDAEEETETRR